MAYAVLADVREICGNILNTEFADAEITKECNAADSWVNTKTHKSDWDSGDIQHNLIIKIANKKASEFVLEHYGSEFLPKIQDLRLECEQLIQDVIDNMPPDDTTGLDTLILVDRSNYQSYPLSLEDDPEAIPYISTTVNYSI